jgi:hypothetical protein
MPRYENLYSQNTIRILFIFIVVIRATITTIADIHNISLLHSGPSCVVHVYIKLHSLLRDRLCGLVVRVPGYRFRGPGFDSRRYQIFWEVLGLERGPLSLVCITEELHDWKSSGSWSRKSRLTAVGIRCADHAKSSIRKVRNNFADKQRSLGGYSLLAD